MNDTKQQFPPPDPWECVHTRPHGKISLLLLDAQLGASDRFNLREHQPIPDNLSDMWKQADQAHSEHSSTPRYIGLRGSSAATGRPVFFKLYGDENKTTQSMIQTSHTFNPIGNWVPPVVILQLARCWNVDCGSGETLGKQSPLRTQIHSTQGLGKLWCIM